MRKLTDGEQIDIKDEIKKIRVAAEKAEIQALIINGAKAGIQLQFIRLFEYSLNLEEGDKVRIAYEDKDRMAIYGGSRSTGHCVWVLLRFFSKKGRIAKRASRESYDIMEYITKAEE